MAERLRIAELDFDTIKTNLKNFLRNQNEFTDYDFDGSGLSVLLDILAYNTHYQAYYLNMVANESFLDTALLRDSVVSHAKTLGYTPASKKASTASINLTVFSFNTDPEQLTLPKGTLFLSNQIDNKTYNFVTLDDVTVSKVGENFYFQDLNVHEGELNQIRFVYTKNSNPKSIFLLPDDSIDKSTIRVSVSPGVGNTNINVYQLATDLAEINSESEVYFLQEERSGKYQIYFGNGAVGKSLDDGSVVTVEYLSTNGDLANGARTFVIGGKIGDYSDFDIETVLPSYGGSDRESVDSIKYLSPLQYASQNRIVSFKDYELYIRSHYPNLESISVWGGEDELPPIYGKVFISLKPADGYYISETEKTKILDEIITPRSVITIRPEFRDPDYTYLLTSVNVEYDPRKTSMTENVMKNAIRDAVVFYKNQYLNKFNAKFAVSKLQELVDSVELNSIVGSDTTIRVQKRIAPILNKVSNYTINFNVPLLQGTTFNKISSTEFYVNDLNGIERRVSLEEVPKAFTGVNSIQVLNPGTGYTSEPTVTITGDGFGATAKAIVSLGKIQSIEVTNPGIDYNKAVVTISGGGGYGASGLAVIDSKVGKLRTVYYNLNAERVIVNTNAGEVNYDTGVVTLNDINILRTETSDGLIRLNSGVQYNIIQTVRNTILTVDDLDPTSISVSLQTV